MTSAGYVGGAPILGEGLALDLMNTYYAARGKPAEGIGSPEHATAWLQEIADRLSSAGAPSINDVRMFDDDLDALLELREAVRRIAGAVVEDRRAEKRDVEYVNRQAALSPHWAAINWGAEGSATKTTQAAGAPVDQVLSALASDAIDLFTGADAARLRLCERPGCVLYFVKNHARREWCTPACGARVRAARSYEKRMNREREFSR